jgi:ParB family chromosome partitioning protein
MSLLDPVLRQVSPHILTPHPLNASIYGEDEDVSSLVELIRESGWVRPLVVTTDYVIVSGYRRWEAVKKLGWETIPVEVREFPDSITILETLLLENVSRDRTLEVRIREGLAWEEVEKEKARIRRGTRTDLKDMVENFPPCSKTEKFGKSRDAIGMKIGLSGRSYSKGRKVIKTIDTEVSLENYSSAKALKLALSSSIDAAYKLAKKPDSTRKAIANLLETGKAGSTTAAIRLLRDQTKLMPDLRTQSCWNCQHRSESIDNQTIYCNKFGILNLVDKSGDQRGQECPEWRDSSSPTKPLNKRTFVLELRLPIEWKEHLEATAASLDQDAATWVTNLIGRSLFPSHNFSEHCDGNSNDQRSEKNQLLSLSTVSAPIAVIHNSSSLSNQAQCDKQPTGREQN